MTSHELSRVLLFYLCNNCVHERATAVSARTCIYKSRTDTGGCIIANKTYTYTSTPPKITFKKSLCLDMSLVSQTVGRPPYPASCRNAYVPVTIKATRWGPNSVLAGAKLLTIRGYVCRKTTRRLSSRSRLLSC